MTLEAIKAAIAELPEAERTSLANWLELLARQDAAGWDKQMEADFSEGGAGTTVLESWDAEIKAGDAVPLEEFLSQQEANRKPK